MFYPAIPDLEAEMKRLSAKLLSGNHYGRSCPEGWMAGVLSKVNAEESDKRRIADAKVGLLKP